MFLYFNKTHKNVFYICDVLYKTIETVYIHEIERPHRG